MNISDLSMSQLNSIVEHLTPATNEGIQLQRGWQLWHSQLSWYEKNIGSPTTLKSAYDRLTAYSTVEKGSLFGEDLNITRPVLRLGSAGVSVKLWQKILGLPETGVFDQTTYDATKNYQRAHGLVADGKVGPMTWQTVRQSGVDIQKIAGQLGLVGGLAITGLGIGFFFGGK